MNLELNIGIKSTSEMVVCAQNTAKIMGSGTLDVLATPSMVALMENAAMNAVAPYLAEGSDTVGVEICAKHLRATPLGVNVAATATLTAIDGRKLDFEITATDDLGVIGTASHSRYIIDAHKFMSKIKR